MHQNTHIPDPDRRDALFQYLEEEARRYNIRRAYLPTSRDLARAHVSASKRNWLDTATGVLGAVLASLGWLNHPR